MRRLLVACLILGACTAPEAPDVWVSTAPKQEERAAEIGPLRPAVSVETPVVPTTLAPATVEEQPAPTTTTTEAPRPPVTAASRSRGAPNCGGWYELVASYDWPTDTACRVLLCESGGNADARNPSGATGLMQIMGGPTDPAENMAVAYDMWRHRGWQPWVCK